MVESNHDEERLARIEQMIERLQRHAAAHERATMKLAASTGVEIELRTERALPRKSKVKTPTSALNVLTAKS